MISNNNECYSLNVCIDERLFGDTIFKVERINNDYIISDIFIYKRICK